MPVMQAQNFRGGITGSLTDRAGAVIANIDITATEQSTGVAHLTRTSAAGEYHFTDLPPGDYSVTVSAPGFRAIRINNVRVDAGAVHGLPLSAQVASADTTVEVTSATNSLDTETSTNTTTLPGKALQQIPFHSGDFLDANAYIPGYSGSSNQGNGSINGTRQLGINYEVDGTDNNDAWHNRNGSNEGGLGSISGSLLPIDALAEISFQSASDSDVGRSPAGTVNTILKSGTNQIHGDAYYFLRHEALSVANPFLPEGYGTPENRNGLWGGSIGGPIAKDRTFYFLAFEKQQFGFLPIGSTTEPGTAYQAEANGLLAAHGVAANAVTSALLQYLWPANALSNPLAQVNNFQPSGSEANSTGYSDNFLVKLDHTFNSKNTLSGHWYIGEGNQTGQNGSGGYLKPYYEVAPMHVQNFNVVYNHIFTPAFTNQLLLGASSFLQRFFDYEHNQDPASVGFVTGSEFLGAPLITITGFDTIGDNPPEGRNSTTGHITDNASWSAGKHQLRFGGEYRRVHTDAFYFYNSRGSLTTVSASTDPWYADTTVVPQGQSAAVSVDSNAKALADFLSGRIDAAGITLGNQDRLVLLNTWAIYASDSWKLTPKLEINAGLRYEYQGPYYNNNGNISAFVQSKGGVVYVGDGISSLYPAYKTPFGPRVGFSYQPRAGVVVRAGAGIYYDTPSTDNFFSSGGIQSNPGGNDPVSAITLPTVNGVVSTPIEYGVNYYASGSAASILSIYTPSQTWKTPKNYNYYLQLEKSLGNSGVFQLAYVGTQGRNQIGKVDLNPSALNSTGNTEQSTRPYAAEFPSYGKITDLATNTSSNYNSLQAVVRTSQFHGLAGQAAYTWSHNLDYFTSATLIPNYMPLSRFYATADIDQSNVFTGYATYVIPALAHGPRRLVGGWSLSTGFNFHSGQPFTITYTDNTGSGDGTQYANRIAAGNPLVGRSHAVVKSTSPYKSGYVAYLSPTAIADSFSVPANGTFGSEQRNQLRGPGYADIDLSVVKDVRISERYNFQFRAELNNLYNHLNLASPTTSLASSAVGEITGTIGGSGGPGVSPGEPFYAQLVGKFNF
ncbi:TonB-dependent receptor domain-containing protein [Silvibacterium sp.]|uniref:TonB-dependent receptor domain-containing protein n=1 Tax=Silvibacterium sp. TaxID=1964179 RepID=UPI0039E2E59B